MIAYLDSTVILRIVLGQRGALREWRSVRRGVASALVEVECLRSLDRLLVAHGVPDAELALRREAVLRLLETLEVVEIGRTILQRAAQPLPTALGTLDAIHLATALAWQGVSGTPLAMATHDEALAIAARAHGMQVVGV